MADFSIGEMQEMQRRLQEKYRGRWEAISPETGKNKRLWMTGEIGEVIDVIKKRGDDEIMNNPETRAHFVEELSDVWMYLCDVMLCYGISAEEYSELHARKHARNMKRNYVEENRHMFDKNK